MCTYIIPEREKNESSSGTDCHPIFSEYEKTVPTYIVLYL